MPQNQTRKKLYQSGQPIVSKSKALQTPPTVGKVAV